MEQTFFFTNQCTDFSDGVHFTTVYYNEYGDSFNSWNICLDIENHTFTKVYNNRGSNIMDVTYLQMYIASAHDLNKTAKKLSDVNGNKPKRSTPPRQDNPSAGEFFVYIKFSSLMYPRIIAAISPICLSPSSGIASVETRV